MLKTEVTLKNIKYVSNLRPYEKKFNLWCWNWSDRGHVWEKESYLAHILQSECSLSQPQDQIKYTTNLFWNIVYHITWTKSVQPKTVIHFKKHCHKYFHKDNTVLAPSSL